MNLYQKYRPKTIDEMVGNKAEFAVFEKLAKGGTRAFLLCGASGCGKTTLARIAGNMLNGEIIEINSSDDRGVAMARDIIEMIKFKPLGNKKLIFILDEFHRATIDFQNAILKPLEDMPDYVYFFLGTTNPEKLIKTIHTRCSRITFQNLAPKDLQELLERVALAENAKDWVKNLFPVVIDNSDGSARQALVFLEKILQCNSEKEAEKVLYNLEAEDANTIHLCRAVIAGDWRACLEHLKNLQGKDPENIRRAILGYAAKVALNVNSRGLDVLYVMRQDIFSTGMPGLISLVGECCQNQGRR
jgi:DNA polymerase III gamma/tau subunit